MIRMTLSEYLRKPKDYRGEWTTERWDIPNWEEEREKYMGKRTLMTNIDGATCLVVEGMRTAAGFSCSPAAPSSPPAHRYR